MDLVKKVEELIRTKGIPKYIKKWKPLKIPEKFKTQKDLYDFLQKYVESYHFHTQITWWSVSHQEGNLQPMPNFSYLSDKKIGIIEFYHFLDSTPTKTKADYIKIGQLVKFYMKTWEKLGLNGLIIDLCKHSGGNMWPFIHALSNILGDTTLFAFANHKVKPNEPLWYNMKNGKIIYGKKGKTELGFKKPIAVLVSDKTASTGEFIAAMFCGRKNAKLFGDKTNKTAGYATMNYTYPITKSMFINLTNSLLTTIYGKYHEDECLIVPKHDRVFFDSEKWIADYNKK
jgi:C-terminal processing protease CtpA/Prc